MVSLSLWLFSVLLVILSISWYLKFRWDRRKIYKMMGNIKQPSGHLLFGHSLKFLGLTPVAIFKQLLTMTYENGPNFGVWLGPVPVVVIGNPEDLEKVLQSQQCVSKSFHYRFTESVVGQGLFSAPVEKWRKTRKIIQPTFNTKILDNFVSIFVQTSTIFVNEILPKYVNKKNVDWFKIFTALNLDTISQTAMGLNTDAQRKMFKFSEHLGIVMRILFLRFFNVFLYPDFIFKTTQDFQELKHSTKFIHNFTDTVVQKKKAEFEQKLEERIDETLCSEGPLKRKVFLDMLLEINYKNPIFTDREIRDEVNTIFVGGTDTSAITSCFFLMMMGMHPEIQDQVYEEIIDVLGAERVPDPSDLQNLSLLERCLKETMRLFSPAPFIAREIKGKELELSDMTLPDGIVLCLMIYFVHRSEKFWEQPLKFDPDRFLPENFSKQHPYSYLPFSGGLRPCIGMRYSYMNLKTVLSRVLRRYKVYCDYKTVEEIEVENNIVIRPTKGFKFHLEERK